MKITIEDYGVVHYLENVISIVECEDYIEFTQKTALGVCYTHVPLDCTFSKAK